MYVGRKYPQINYYGTLLSCVYAHSVCVVRSYVGKIEYIIIVQGLLYEMDLRRFVCVVWCACHLCGLFEINGLCMTYFNIW